MATYSFYSLDFLWWDGTKELGYYNDWQKLAEHLRKVSSTLRGFKMSVSSHTVDDYLPENGDRRWVYGVWERRGWLQDLKFLTKLERLEIPWVVILGYTPNFSDRKLRDVLPDGIKELHFCDDLADVMYNTPCPYQWNRLDQTYTTNVTPPTYTYFGPVFENIEDYFVHGHGKSLQILTTTYELGDSSTISRWEQTLRRAGVETRMHISN